MKLSCKQIEEFNQNGLLLLKNFANQNVCNDILQKAKNHLENKIAPIESEEEFSQSKEKPINTRRLRQAFNRAEIFQQWMTDDKLKPILGQLLSEEPVLVLAHHNSIMTKMPIDNTRTPWHQDIRYWNYTNDNLISVWLSLDDETINNGLLEFIPFSHKIKFDKNQFDEKNNFRDDCSKNKELIKTAVHSNLQKGDIVLFHCKTLHHANKNSTLKTKFSFVYTVRAKSNTPIKNTKSDFKEINL